MEYKNNKTELQSCIITNNLEEKSHYKTHGYTGMHQWTSVFNGKIFNARYILPILKKKNFDIIFINLSKQDITLVQDTKETLNLHSRTKIFVINDLTIEQILDDFTATDKLAEHLKSAEKVFSSQHAEITLLEKIIRKKVYKIYHPVNISLLKSIQPPRQRSCISIIWDKYEDNAYFEFLKLQKQGIEIRFIAYNPDNKTDTAKYHISCENFIREKTCNEFYNRILESKILYYPYHNRTYESSIIDAAAAGIPVVGCDYVESVRRCYPYTSYDLYKDHSAPDYIHRLLDDDDFYTMVSRTAKQKAEFYNLENSRKRFINRLFDIYHHELFKEKSFWIKYELYKKKDIPFVNKNDTSNSETRILGCHTCHDGGAAYLKDGELIYYVEAEKDNNVRHSFHFDPEKYLEFLKERNDLPDKMALMGEYNYHPYFGTSKDLLRIERRNILGKTIEIFFSTHERAHIFCSYGMSPFRQGEPCYVLTWEGGIGKFYKIDNHLNIYPYDHVIQYPGTKFEMAYYIAGGSTRVNNLSAAGKMTALAGFASQTAKTNNNLMLDEVNYILDLENVWFHLSQFHKKIFPAFRSLSFYNTGVESRLFKDFTWKLQDSIFERFYDFAKINFKEKIPLLISGGCGLNCKWNKQFKDSGLFSDIFIPPCTNDSGMAIGTAIDAQFCYTNNAKIKWDVYAGDEFIHDKADLSHFTIYDLDYDQISDFLIKDLNVIAWVQGKYEIGPRALCHRSLIAAPFSEKTHKKLNKIKQREGFRPIAPVCLEEDAHKYFDWKGPSPYMLFFQKVLSNKLKAVTHVDGTARLQTIPRDPEERIYHLLKKFKSKTGYSVLCNTSLNFKGRGFINRMSDLVHYIADNNVNGMVVENKFYIKKNG